MLKKILATTGLAAGLALLAPSAAFAGTVEQYVNVNPGATVCIRDSSVAYSTARGEGNVVTGHAVRFTFGSYTTLYDTYSPVNSFAAQASPQLYPGSFPGRFQVCAINQSLKPSYVRLLVTGS